MNRYFWNTIIFFIVVSFVLLIVVFIKQSDQADLSQTPSKSPITTKVLEIISDEMKHNLEENLPAIIKNHQITTRNIHSIIDNNIDILFDEIIDNNLEKYLDFHYSIIGEYTQLWAMTFGDINELINQKILGEDFSKKLEIQSNNIVSSSYEEIKKHLDFTTDIATQSVDLELNQNSLSKLSQDIENNLKQNLVEIKAALIGASIATKLAISIASKISAKIALKTTGKTASKLVTSTTAAIGGGVCGLAAPLCGIAFGTIAWFGTDAAVIGGDEYLNRDDLKQEIIDFLDEAKKELKSEYLIILEQLNQISQDHQEKLKNTQTKKRVIENLQ
ncbi:MAG: hypothetical protein ACOX39_00515 [Arcobacteraceae bacterium]